MSLAVLSFLTFCRLFFVFIFFFCLHFHMLSSRGSWNILSSEMANDMTDVWFSLRSLVAHITRSTATSDGEIYLDLEVDLLAFCTIPIAVESWCKSLSTQHDHIMPPEHESIGLPPASTHDILRPHSNRRPLYLHVCGITAKGEKKEKKNKL